MRRPTAEEVAAVVEQFREAGVGQGAWVTALDGLARITGSMGAQLVGLGGEALVPFNMMTGVPEETADAFVAVGGGDPAINSRVRVGMRAAELEVLDESAFTTAADMERNSAYAEWIHDYHMHFACLTCLVKGPDELAGLAILRNERNGNVDAEERRVFAEIARHARSAVRTQLALEAQGAQLLAGAMDAVRAVAFFCDGFGRVRGMTSSAETMVAAGDVLRLAGGVLTTACEADRRRLETAIAHVAHADSSSFTVAARRLQADERLLVEVAPLPGSAASGLGSRVLVIVHGGRPDEHRVAGAVRSLFELSHGEAAVAAMLASGRTPPSIAQARGVAIGTIRAQVRRVYEKMGVSSQLELTAKIPKL